MGRKILHLRDNLTQQREGIRYHVLLAHLMLHPGSIGSRLERVGVIGENDFAARQLGYPLHVTGHRVLILRMQGSDLKGYARTSIAGVHNSFVLTLLPHVGEVHGHDPHAHLAAQPVAQFASSCSSRLPQIVMTVVRFTVQPSAPKASPTAPRLIPSTQK